MKNWFRFVELTGLTHHPQLFLSHFGCFSKIFQNSFSSSFPILWILMIFIFTIKDYVKISFTSQTCHSCLLFQSCCCEEDLDWEFQWLSSHLPPPVPLIFPRDQSWYTAEDSPPPWPEISGRCGRRWCPRSPWLRPAWWWRRQTSGLSSNSLQWDEMGMASSTWLVMISHPRTKLLPSSLW